MNENDCTIQITYNRSGTSFRYGLNAEQAYKVVSYVKKQLEPVVRQEPRGTLVGLFDD